MKTEPSYNHPMNLYARRIKEEGIVVFDDVRGLPSGDEPFISPDYVICIGHRGRIELMYDDITDYSEQYSDISQPQPPQGEYIRRLLGHLDHCRFFHAERPYVANYQPDALSLRAVSQR